MTPTSRLDELTARARRTLAATTPSGGAGGEAPAQIIPPLPARERGPGGEGRTPSTCTETPATIVLGIDPGIGRTGYAIIAAAPTNNAYHSLTYGVVETPPNSSIPHRLNTIFTTLTDLIATHHPTQAAVEKLFFGRNTTTALTVGQARGVALLAIARAGLEVAEYTPAEVKFALSSYGRATKRDIQRMTQLLLHLSELPTPDDAADALAVALCHAQSMRARAVGLR